MSARVSPLRVALGYIGASLARLLARRKTATQNPEERYARALLASNDGIWEWNPATDEIFISDRARRLWAVPDGVPIVTRTDLKRLGGFHPEDLQRTEEVIAANRLPGTRSFAMEYRVLGAAGDVRWLRSHGKAFPGADGQPTLVTGSLTDITERKHAEEALRESEQRYERAVLASNAGVWEWDARKDEYYCSPRHLELLGLPPGTRFAGREDFMRRAPFHPDDKERWRQEQTQLFASGSSNLVMDLRVIGGGATRWVRVNALCFRDDAGAVARWTGSVTDVTEAKRAEEGLRESQDRYQRVMLASNAGLWDWDVATGAYYVSARLLELAGFAPGTAFAGREDFMRRAPFHPEDIDKWHETVRQLFASTDSHVAMEEVRVIVGGHTRWVRLNGICFRDAAGKVARWTGSATEITERKHAEEALRRSEERYSLAMAASEEGHFDLDLDSGEIFISERLNEIYGFPPGTRFANRGEYLARLRLHPDDAEKYHAALAAALAKDGPEKYEFEFRILQAAGEVRWLRTRGKVMRDAEGRARRRTGLVADITERKLAEEALRESEARKSAMFESALDCIITIDHEGRIVEFNPAAERTFGYRRAAALGKELAELIIPPRLRARHREGLARYLKGGAGPVLGTRTEMPAVRADGTEFPVELTVTRIATESSPLFTAYLRDITERKRSEETLRNSEQRYALAMEAAGDGHTDWNLQTGEHYISPRLLQICGYAPGTTFRDRAEWVRRFPFHPEDRAKWEQAVAAHFAGREAQFKMELRIVVGGEVRWTAFHFLCTRDAAGTPIRWTGSIGDITEQKRADEALRASEKRYERAMLAAEAGFWDWDAATDQYYVSDKLREMTRIPAGTKLATRADFMTRVPFHPEDRANYEKAVKDLFASGGTRLCREMRLIFDDETRWNYLSGVCMRDASGRVVRWTGSATDITDRKRAEMALRQSEERFALAVAGSDDGIWDVDFAAGRVFVSARARELAGLPPGPEFMPMEDYFAGLPLHPDDVPRRMAAMQAHLSGNAPAYEGEFRLRQRDGVYRWRRIHGICVRDAHGQPQRMAGSFADVDARRRAEDALRASEERYTLAVAGSNDGIWDWDLLTGKMFVSERAQHIFGLEPGPTERLRDEWHAMISFHPHDHDAQRRMVEEYLSGARSSNEGEWRVQGKDGGYRWIRIRSICLRNAAGEPVRMAGSVSDIDAHKRAEAALRLSEERYALAMDVAEEGHLDWNAQTDEFFASAQARRVMNVPQDAECRTRDDVMRRVPYHPEDGPRVSAAWRASLAGRDAEHDIDYRILRGNEPRWIRARWKIFRGADGKAQRVIGVVSDITERKQAVETLRESEARFRALTELSSDAYWAQDENLRFVPTGAKHDLAGHPADSHVGMTRRELPDATPLSGTWDEHEAVLQARKPFRDFEYRRLGPDGSVRYLSISGAPIFDHQGVFRGYQGVGRDITDRKRAEEEVRESEARFRSLVELSSDWYWKQDENLRFVGYVPPEVGSRSGVAAASSLGKARWEFDNITPLSGTWEDHKAVLAARQPFRDFEYVRLDTEGVAHYTVISGVPLFDAEGRFIGYHGVGRNISQRRRMEEDLRTSEARFRRMTELSADTYWEQDENFRYTRTGSEKDIAGYAIDVNQGKTRWELCGEATPLSSSWREHQAVLAAHQPFRDFEYRRLRPDGSMGYYSASGAPMFDSEGRFTGYQGVARDITEFKRVEEDLRQSEGRFRALTELSSDWYWQQDADLRFTYVSHQVADKNLYPREWVIGKTRWELPGITPLSFTWAEHQAAVMARQPFRDLEYSRVGRDGRREYVSISGAPIFDEQGNFRGYRGTGRNITERKHIEEDLRSRQEMLELAQKSARAVAFEWKIGEAEGENRWSPDLEAMYGFAPGTYDGTYEMWKKRVHPEDWPAVKEAVKYAHRTGDVDAEYRVVHPDGSIHWLHAKGRMLFDGGGRPARMVGFMHDVSDRKRVEEALRQSEERYALAVAGSNEGIFDWDLVSDRVYVSYRAQELFGLPRGELWRPRRDWRHILAFHPDDAARLHDSIKAHIEGGTPTYDMEFRIVLSGGAVRWFRQRGIALRDASGKAYRVVGSIGDVTDKHIVEEELKGLERKLRLAQRLEAMGTLAGGIAHDFNNILGAILGYGEMALRDAAKGSRLRRDLDSIIVAGERGRALVDRVLAFSRSGVGERVPVHVEKVVREALDLISANLPPNVTLHTKLHARDAAMLGDATQVHQVLMNLATNAIQSMPAGGTLRVSLRAVRLESARAPTVGILERGEYLVLELADTGTGIPPEILDRIFDPFFTTKEVGTGTGLGLSLVHGIVTDLGGAIDIASTVGAGSVFTVYLPRSGDAVDDAQEDETDLPRGDGQCVLVVDDEEPLVELATRTLEELGYAPVGFTSSAAALAAFRADPKRFDAVITDERMPGLSGSALIRAVRGIHGSIPIVLMSGYVGAAVARHAREAGAEELLKKPLSARDLAASLARVLQQ